MRRPHPTQSWFYWRVTHVVSAFVFTLVFFSSILRAEIPTATPIASTLSDNAKLESLVSSLDTFYKASITRLFELQGKAEVRDLGQRVREKLMASYDARIAGRCTKTLVSQTLTQYIQAAIGRVRADGGDQGPIASERLEQDFNAVLAPFNLKREDLRANGDCNVFEYDLEPLYESPITVHDPWFFNHDRQARSFIRLGVKGQSAPIGGGVEGGAEVPLFAQIGAGRSKGYYEGVARRDLHSDVITISLLRKGSDPLLLDGEFRMAGNQYSEPVLGRPAPKLAARTMFGELTTHDGERYTIKNQLLFVARESNEAIEKALGANAGGFKIPEVQAFGSFLNLVVLEVSGDGISKKVESVMEILTRVYKQAQKDNPIQSYHPILNPLFSDANTASFLILDVASDVNAQASHDLRSVEVSAELAKQGLTIKNVLPFFEFSKGRFALQFAGKSQLSLKFDSFETLSKSLMALSTGLQQEQQRVFEKVGVLALSKKIQGLRQNLDGIYNSMGPRLDALLDGETPEVTLDGELSAAIEKLGKQRQVIGTVLAQILDTRDEPALTLAYEEYLKTAREILDAAASRVEAKKPEIVAQVRAELAKEDLKAFEGEQLFMTEVLAAAPKIKACVRYMETFGVQIQIKGKVIDSSGKLVSKKWSFARTLPQDLADLLDGYLK